MASERQIAANRANALKSTGPKTAAGRLRSSGNAFRHGLSLPLPLDEGTAAKAELIARALVDDHNEERLSVATEVAHAQLELVRIHSVRADLMRTLDVQSSSIPELKRLVALDRYERLAHSKRRRAARKLQAEG